METLTAFFKSHGLAWRGKTIVVAASGGPDSMALLDMARRLLGARVIAAHFDHRLRPDSGQEEKVIQAYCQQHGLSVAAGDWPPSQHPQTGVEAAARQARYQFLDQVCRQAQADYLLTAHQGDDLLENILLKLLRSGYPREMNSLAPVSRRQAYWLLRPLLSWQKQDLLAYDRQHNLDFIIDRTNQEPITLRNQLRLTVVPRLKQISPGLVANANRFAHGMEELAFERNQYFAGFPEPRWLFPGVLTGPQIQQADYYAWLVAKHWHRQANFAGGWNQDHFAVCFNHQHYFLINKQQVPQPRPARQAIELGQPFVFAGQKFRLTTGQSAHEIGYFYGPHQKRWAAGTLPVHARLQTAAGQLVKPKKYFRLPKQLRPLCLTIFNGQQPWFVQTAYRWQGFSKSFIRYSVQALLK